MYGHSDVVVFRVPDIFCVFFFVFYVMRMVDRPTGGWGRLSDAAATTGFSYITLTVAVVTPALLIHRGLRRMRKVVARSFVSRSRYPNGRATIVAECCFCQYIKRRASEFNLLGCLILAQIMN